MRNNRSVWLRSLALALTLMLASGGVAVGDGKLPEDRGSAGLWRTLLELRTTASALHVTAHPDDEDGSTLTMLARGQGVHTMLLTLNRGEGGADLIAPFFFDALGVLRTLELLQSDRYYGVDQFFSHMVDYGFSKTLNETLTKWGGEEDVLSAVVRVVRRERPEVIIARFRGNTRDGHGNHQTAGLMAQRVFDAAADPNRFPEQIAEGLRPWRPKKLYMNNIRPDFRPEDKELVTLVVDSGVYDPILGRSYAQISRQGLGYQRSQGTAGRAQPAGSFRSYYKLLKTSLPGYSAQTEKSFFDGMDTSITGIGKLAGSQAPSWLTTGLSQIHAAVEAAVSKFDSRAPAKTVPSLVEGLKATRSLLEQVKGSSLADDAKDQIQFLLNRKERQFQKGLSQALGLDVEVAVDPDEIPTGPFAAFITSPTFNHAIPGQKFSAQIRVVNRSNVEVTPARLELKVPAGWSATAGEAASTAPLKNNDEVAVRFSVQVAADATPTRPYWHRDSIEEAVYTIDQKEYFTRPFPPPPAWGVVRLSVAGVEFTVKEPLRVTLRDPQTGTVHPALAVVPAVSVRFPVEHGVLPVGTKDYAVSVIVRSNAKGPAEGTVRLKLPAVWSSEPAAQPFSFAKEDEEATFYFTVKPSSNVHQEAYTIEAVASYGGKEYSEGFITVTAADVDRFNLYRAAKHHVRGADIKVAGGLRVGYVMGSGDDIPQTLGMIGVQPVMLGPSDLANADLNQYDSIVLGVRAYAARPDVKTYNGRLLDYVKNGGVLIVQYQTPEYDNNYGPYPYSQTNRPEEVSEEDAKVTILEPNNPVFQGPNKITAADFDAWVEERGSKFIKEWDPRYKALLECHDQGQEPQKGGMLYAEYGKGVYIYSAYAWYRQLPHGVTGAYRVYANMLSLGKSRASGMGN